MKKNFTSVFANNKGGYRKCAFIALFLFFASAMSSSAQVKVESFFGGYNLGMSLSEVKAVARQKGYVLKEEKPALHYSYVSETYRDEMGESCLGGSFKFYKNALKQAMFSTVGMSKSYEELLAYAKRMFDEVLASYTREYGKPYDYIQKGRFYEAKWKTDNCEITLTSETPQYGAIINSVTFSETGYDD